VLGTEYNFAVEAINVAGTSVKSDDFVYTHALAPDAPAAPSVLLTSENDI
jgi:hypothetical protein